MGSTVTPGSVTWRRHHAVGSLMGASAFSFLAISSQRDAALTTISPFSITDAATFERSSGLVTAHTSAWVSRRYTSPPLEEVVCLAIRHGLPPSAANRPAIHLRILTACAELDSLLPERHQLRYRFAVAGNHDGFALLHHSQQAGKLGFRFVDIELHVDMVVQVMDLVHFVGSALETDFGHCHFA